MDLNTFVRDIFTSAQVATGLLVVSVLLYLLLGKALGKTAVPRRN